MNMEEQTLEVQITSQKQILKKFLGLIPYKKTLKISDTYSVSVLDVLQFWANPQIMPFKKLYMVNKVLESLTRSDWEEVFQNKKDVNVKPFIIKIFQVPKMMQHYEKYKNLTSQSGQAIDFDCLQTKINHNKKRPVHKRPASKGHANNHRDKKLPNRPPG